MAWTFAMIIHTHTLYIYIYISSHISQWDKGSLTFPNKSNYLLTNRNPENLLWMNIKCTWKHLSCKPVSDLLQLWQLSKQIIPYKQESGFFVNLWEKQSYANLWQTHSRVSKAPQRSKRAGRVSYGLWDFSGLNSTSSLYPALYY